MRRLAISFSGGETSAFMTWLIMNNYSHLYDEIQIVFMNTSRENEACLQFVDRCNTHLFQKKVVWLEAVVFHNERKGCGHKIVSYETANRDGSVFENMISKYGVPNTAFPHCNRELKLNPFRSYLRSLGWTKGSYDVAIGIRVDEIDRMAANALLERIVYPLISWRPTKKIEINSWFAKQPFRLQQKGYQGNCTNCWKKSLRKLYTIAKEQPESFFWTGEMERRYGNTFFRGSKSSYQILSEAFTSSFKPADDDSIVYDFELDQGGSCDGGETCEPFASDGGT